MHFLIKIILFTFICMRSQALLVENPNDEIVVNTSSEKPMDNEVAHERKPKQYLQYDGVQAAPVQQPGFLPGLGGGQLPIIGTLVGNLPGLVGGLPGQLGGLLPGQLGSTVTGLVGGLPGQLGGLLGGLPGGLGTTVGGLTQGLGLGNLGLGGGGGGSNQGVLGPLGGLLNLGGLGGGSGAPQVTCPITQKLNCKCEPLIAPPKTLLERKRNSLEILQHTEHSNEDGTTELSAILSNGLTIYQQSGIVKDMPTTQGFYSLKLKEQRYLTIYFIANDLDYTLKADVSAKPPRTDVVAKQIGNFV